ncbi:hypothetical protein DL96DRAFT_1713848 [Flagelloscypha sp. PMI_526]|nr:hypothetical protein DL96DRAFT_1713848 [Flagelloscypha sp. PMI_526]
MSLEEYAYKPSPNDANVWERKCYGLESLASSMEESLDGFPHLTATIAVKPAYERAKLEPAVKAAWISLRHSLPVIAAKSGRLAPPDNHFTFKYFVPKNLKSAEEWAEETVFFSDEVKSPYEAHKTLKDGQWWKPSADHWVGELHVSPIPEGWQFSVVFIHNSIDGRNGFAVLDELLSKLVPILEGTGKPVAELSWGEETSRLSPAGAILIAQADIVDTKPKVAAPPPPGGAPQIPFLWTPAQTSNKGDIAALITLPADTTAKLHELSKAHGKTVTQVITALSILAHTEVALTAAAKAGEERFKLVAGSFNQATFYLIAWNFINHRHKFPGGFKSLSSETPSPLCTADGVPLILPMDPIRKFFTIDEQKLTVATSTESAAFWDGLVETTAGGWKSHDTSLQAYWDREAVAHQSIHTFQPQVFHVPALIVSSVGDVDGRLDILSSYTPSKGNKTLTITEAITGIRMRVPPLMNLLWQFDGKLSCQWFTAGEYTTQDELDSVVEVFKKWIGIFIV